MSEPKESIGAPQVKDRRLLPSGILPKNAQAWTVSGIALVMVAVIALSGKNAPKEKVSPLIPGNSAIDPNQAKIEEYKRRIEVETEKLRREQADLAQAKMGQTALAGSERPAANSQRSVGADYAAYREPGGYSSGETVSQRNALQAEIAKRDYESLFAPNVVLSYRKDIVPRENSSREFLNGEPLTPDPASTAASALAKILPIYSMLGAAPPGSRAAPTAMTPPTSAAPSAPAPVSPETSVAPGASAAKRPGEPLYRLDEGSVLETVLTGRLDGLFSGPVNCMVTTNRYSPDGRHLLVPQGTRVLGEVRKVDSLGQSRLAVFFHRLIMPDGNSVNLDQFQGLNQIGETGLQDKINHHYVQVFGVSLAIGAIAGLGRAGFGSGTGVDPSGVDAYGQGVANSLSQSALRILDRYLNVLPTFTIREGHRVKVFLSADLLLPDYDRHHGIND